MPQTTTISGVSPSRPDRAVSPPVVLVVDDHPVNTAMLGSILQREGFQVLIAHSGPVARTLACGEHPDVILLDVVMPDESGIETCAKLKADPRTADIPILFVSALDEVEHKVNGLRVGAVDYISKPFQAEEVLARVRVHLRISQANRALIEAQRARLEELRHAQRAILVRPEDLPEVRFGVYFNPLEETGGDFYDAVRIDEHAFGFFVADVSGHGVGASFLTSAIKTLVRQYSGPLFSPLDTMRSINTVLRTVMPEDQYLTACWARWNRRSSTLSVVSAGHPPLILMRSRDAAEPLTMEGDPLGVFGTVTLQLVEVRVSTQDRFFLYTDGIIETPTEAGGARSAGLASLLSRCEETRAIPIGAAPRVIVERLRPGAVQDDLLLLGVEVTR